MYWNAYRCNEWLHIQVSYQYSSRTRPFLYGTSSDELEANEPNLYLSLVRSPLAYGQKATNKMKRARCALALVRTLLGAERRSTPNVIFEIALLTSVGEHIVKGYRASGVLALKEALPLSFPLAVVISRRADVLVRSHEGRSDHQLHSVGFGLRGGLYILRFMSVHLRDDMGNVVGLPVQHIGEVRRQAGLSEPHMEEVQEQPRMTKPQS